MFIILKTELPTHAMFLLPAECKPVLRDTQVSATKTATTNGSTWWGQKKPNRVLACLLGQHTVSLAKYVPCSALLQAQFYPLRKETPTVISDLLSNKTAHLCAP